MLANPDKFQALLISPKQNENLYINMNFYGANVTSEKSVKVLSINFDDNLTFNTHISEIVCEAGK